GLGGDEDGQGDGHGGQGATDQHPHGHAQDEGEGGVGDGNDAAGVEQQGGQLREVEGVGGLVDGAGPPGHREAAQPRGGHGGQAGEGEFDGQPAGVGDALVPHQPVGAGLELAGEQRRAPEQPDQGGQDQHDGGDRQEGALVVVEEQPDEVRAATGLGGAGGDPGGVVVGQARAGDGEEGGEGGQGGQQHRGRGAELAPGQPDHRWT